MCVLFIFQVFNFLAFTAIPFHSMPASLDGVRAPLLVHACERNVVTSFFVSCAHSANVSVASILLSKKALKQDNKMYLVRDN